MGALKIRSQDTLKILGFVLIGTGGMAENVAQTTKKFNSRLWLRHLKKNKIDDADLIKIYSTLIRTIIEYAAVVYHHLLTQEQAEKIE